MQTIERGRQRALNDVLVVVGVGGLVRWVSISNERDSNPIRID